MPGQDRKTFLDFMKNLEIYRRGIKPHMPVIFSAQTNGKFINMKGILFICLHFISTNTFTMVRKIASFLGITSDILLRIAYDSI